MKTNHDSEAIEMQKRFNEQRSQERTEKIMSHGPLGDLMISIGPNHNRQYVVSPHGNINPELAAEMVLRWNNYSALMEALKALYTYAQAEGLHFDPGWGVSVRERVEAAIERAKQ